MSVAKLIMEYAEWHDDFGVDEIMKAHDGTKRITVLCILSRLVKQGILERKAKGVYSKRSFSSPFEVVLMKQEKAIAGLLQKTLPLVSYCVYNGETLAPLQHHVFYDRASYVEVEREAVETVFHLCKDHGYESYMNPTVEMTKDYIDLAKPVVIVKPLVTESPLTQKEGFKVPTLEKLLVDMRKDEDYYFVQGVEETYILENARSLYDINESRLKRYAKRRNVDPQNFNVQ